MHYTTMVYTVCYNMIQYINTVFAEIWTLFQNDCCCTCVTCVLAFQHWVSMGQIHQESRNTLNRPNILVHCPTHLDNPSKSIISKTRTKGKAVRLGTQLLFSTVIGSRVCGPVGAHLASPMAQVFRFGKGFFKQRTFEMMDEKQMLWPKFWFARFVVNLLQVLCNAWTSACFIMNL